MRQKGKNLEKLCGMVIVKSNQDIIGEQCIRNDDGVLAASDEDNEIVLKATEWEINEKWEAFECRACMRKE